MPELKNILLVEDDPNDAELIITGLAENNLANRVVVVHDGEEALDYLNYRGKFAGRREGYPVVVLLDLKLPKIDGREVLRQIKTDEKMRCLPVIILTSSKEERDIVEGYKLGANTYIVKPVDFHQFIDVIKIVGSYWAIVSASAGRKVRHKVDHGWSRSFVAKTITIRLFRKCFMPPVLLIEFRFPENLGLSVKPRL